MIQYKTGDILQEDAEALVNTVNCVGVMGRGVALQFKKAFPENFKAYAKACRRDELQPGRLFIYKTRRMMPPYYIINFPTKRHWKGKARMEDIQAGLKHLAQVVREMNIRSIALPPLGSGLGGLDWQQVRQLIEQVLSSLEDVRVIVYEPAGAPRHEKMVHNREIPKMTPGRAALVSLMHRYLAGLLDPFVSLLEIHKLMYFMQEAGEPLQLKFQKGPYGPYAENLRHVLNKVEGYFIAGYADGGDAPEKQLKLVPGAVKEASTLLGDYTDTRQRFDRVSELVEGFESPMGLELLSTVHWVINHEAADSVEDIVQHVHAWNSGKQRFTPRQIKVATKVLTDKEWLAACPL